MARRRGRSGRRGGVEEKKGKVFRYLQGEPIDGRRKITTHQRTRTLGYEVQYNGHGWG